MALLDALKLPKTDVVGWSDGAIIGIDLAIRHPDRVGKIVAFGANTTTSGMRDDLDKNRTFLSALDRAEKRPQSTRQRPRNIRPSSIRSPKFGQTSRIGPMRSSKQ